MVSTKHQMMMLNTILNDTKKQLSSAVVHKKHSFRYFTLTTLSFDGRPHSRTVVLRGFDPEKFIFSIYTDSRSEKIKELNNLNRILETLSYEKILDKGFVILKDKDNKIIKDLNIKKFSNLRNYFFVLFSLIPFIPLIIYKLKENKFQNKWF